MDDGPELTADPVALDGVADLATNGVRHARRLSRITVDKGYRDRTDMGTGRSLVRGRGTGRVERTEGGPSPNLPDQADSFLRPLRRRAFKMARPARVSIR
jgi:hypothetical protein